MKRVVSLISMFFMVGSSFAYSDVPQEIEYEEPIEIVETVRIEPNITTLLKEKVKATSNWDSDTSDNTVQINYIDGQILMRIAAAEATTEGTYGMFLVMNVVMNRVQSPDYPDTVWGVVSQPFQFQPITNGTYYTVDIPPEAHEALAMLECNKDNNHEIIAFENKKNGATLTRYFDMSFSYQRHIFYKKKKD